MCGECSALAEQILEAAGLLERAEKARIDLERCVADLIEDNRYLVRFVQDEPPLLALLLGTSEGQRFIPYSPAVSELDEQLAFI